MLYESLFQPLLAGERRWGYGSFEVWQSRPKTLWQAWESIAVFTRLKGWKLLPALEAITDWKEVDQKLAQREREAQVEIWRDWMKTHLEDPFHAQQNQMRVRLTEKGLQLESRSAGATEFRAMKSSDFSSWVYGNSPLESLDAVSLAIWKLFANFGGAPVKALETRECRDTLRALLEVDRLRERLVNAEGMPYEFHPAGLSWRVEPPEADRGDYQFKLALIDGAELPKALAITEGTPSFFLTAQSVYRVPTIPRGMNLDEGHCRIPSEVVETGLGLELFSRLQVPTPQRIVSKMRVLRPQLVARCRLEEFQGHESLRMALRLELEPGLPHMEYVDGRWKRRKESPETDQAQSLVTWDRSILNLGERLTSLFGVKWDIYGLDWQRRFTKTLPEQFAAALAGARELDGVGFELDPLLASLAENPVSAQLTLTVEEKAIDWFDLKVDLSLSDTTLTEEEVRLLLDARGGFVRLGQKGWKRLQFQLDPEQEKELADLGLSARDFSAEPQRLHALQLAGKKAATRMLPEAQVATIGRRAEEIRTRVTPELPPGLQATLRPYQLEGFHFLAYLSENRFGGILADDMGLGKTVQTLAWLLWLRARPEAPSLPSLVVCPKSVTENWASEVRRFAPELSVYVMPTATKAAKRTEDLEPGKHSLVVINYAQLRNVESIASQPWHAVILDEAQAVKNPQSQTAQAALGLKALHRLALSGTPIENRLLDLWSIMAFAMPGILGNRASFARNFDQKTDPLARRRLAARVRPFVLRRTKNEVARDLPERIEEDLHCELEGLQAKLYGAELKRARAALLKIKTGKELDKARFNILTSLLRLRQICCHPALVDPKASKEESAKLDALFDLLEPLVEEGQKVLVFSQFTQMLALIQEELAQRKWNHLLLTGETENRGNLVSEFQSGEGACVFLISLKAGGFGLNLTAASYVILFDPWWNPAVEAQAIDRTHRIGQTSTVIAYRLLVKGSIEEKIRTLQISKRTLSEDVLGEENFTRALSLEDFRFLLEGSF